MDPLKIPELLRKYGQSLAFTAYGTPFFTYKYKKTGLAEKDAEVLLGKTEELLEDMKILLPDKKGSPEDHESENNETQKGGNI